MEPSAAGSAVSSVAGRPTIAVLPFVNISGDAEQEYFVDGMTEDLITDLSKVSGLLVIARNSTSVYKNKPVKVQDVGRELGAAYVVEGSVRRAGDRLRITAQLLRSDTGHHLWAERYDRTITDVFTLQDEVVEKIVAALAVRFPTRERRLVKRVPTDSLEAYDYFLRARSYAWRLAEQDHLRARELYGKALELDPKFGAVYSWLALSHVTSWFLQWTDDVDTMDRAVELAEKAVAVDSADAGSHAVLGAVYGFAKRYDEGMAAARRSLEINPSEAMAYLALGTIANHQGRSDDALRALEMSLRIDPVGNPAVFFHMGVAYQNLGKFEAAMANFRRATRLAPDFSSAHAMLAYLLIKAGQPKRAAESVQEVLRINPEYSVAESLRRLPVADEALIGDWAEVLREAGLK
ncbi:MAG: tetratricopeptide repeat protein [Candidatus Krumholzibacteriia bacterium]